MYFGLKQPTFFCKKNKNKMLFKFQILLYNYLLVITLSLNKINKLVAHYLSILTLKFCTLLI